MGGHQRELEVFFTGIIMSLMFSTLYERYSLNMVVMSRLMTLSLQKFSSNEKADDIEGFYKNRDVKGFDRALNQVTPVFIGLRLICRVWT